MDRGLPTPPGVVPRLPVWGRTVRNRQTPRWAALSFWFLFVVIWTVIGLLQFGSPGAINEVWHWVGDQVIVLQIALWILFLPVMVAIAVWETTMPAWIRVAVLVACLIWTTFGLYPRNSALEGRAEVSPR